MAKNKKNIIIICIVITVLLAGVGALIFSLLSDEDEEVIAAAENSYNAAYLNDSFYEQHPDIVVDGVLEEDCWQDKKWFKNTFYNNVNGTLPRVSYTAFPTDYGIYVAAVAEDTNLFYNGQRTYYGNSSFDFTVGAYNVGEKFAEDGGLGCENLRIDMSGEKLTFNNNVVARIVVEGELNSGNSKGAKLEAFIPWQLLDIDLEKGVPTEIYMMPGYQAIMNNGASAATIQPMMPNGATIIYYRFDADGFAQEDAENALVGDSALGNVKDATWDISKESEGIIQSSPKSEYHNIFFKDMYGSNFIIETTIIPVGQHYGWANAGVIFHRTEIPGSEFYAVMMPMDESILVDSVNGTKNFPDHTIRTWTNYNANWTYKFANVKNLTNSKATSQEGVKLTVVKYGGEFWYFADGKFLSYEAQSFMDTNVLPGLFTVNANAIFKNYSCREIDEKQLQEYLKKYDLNHISLKTRGGGETVASQYTAKNGESCELTMTAKSGYRLTSLKINGKEKLSEVKKKAVDGVYTISNIKTHQKIEAVYTKIDGVSLKGNILANKTAVKGNLLLIGVSNKELRYVVSASETAGFKATVPAGKYRVVITADGCIKAQKTMTLNKDVKQDFRLDLSDFIPELTVNDRKVSSTLSCWNFDQELQNKISASRSSGFASQPLYFRGGVASDFVASVRIDYTTQFKEGVDYQPDLMGGFVFHDGTNVGYIWARDTGVITTGWSYHMGIIPDAVLMRDNPRPAVLTIAKSGDKLHIYFDNVFIKTMDWAVVAPTINANSKMAIGLFAHTDKEADIQFSNWSIQTGKAATDKYISTHKLQNILLKANPMFSEALILNDKQIKSRILSWKLDEVANNVVKGSYGYTGYWANLYFTETGKTALLEATIEYTTQFKDGVDYQPDLFAGFQFTDGTATGWLAANDTGIAYTGWRFQRGLIGSSVLTYPDARPVKLTMAVTEDSVYVYFDDKFVVKKSMDEILPGRIKDADLAFSLFANADKTCDYKFSNLSISTNADVVNQYISAHQ